MEKVTFKGFLEKNRVVIPMLQRDYVQGRLKEPDKSMSSDNLILSSKFVDNIIDTVLNNNENLQLDFIYGIKEKESFEPIDGQQRLTTIWLIHWYAMCSLGEGCEKYMANFTYETRVSSRDFIKSLYMHTNELNQLLFKNKAEEGKYERRFLITIQGQKWFHHFWKQDATIASMLNMLDYIDQTLNRKITKEDLIQLKEKISFREVPMNKHGLDDSLYVKMNARGKLLTPFENFKADLLGDLKKLKDKSDNENKDLYENYSVKLDNNWLDIFWKAAENATKISENGVVESAAKQKTAIMDENFFSFINRFFINKYYSSKTKEDSFISRSGKYYENFDHYKKIFGGDKVEILSDLADTLDSIYHLYYMDDTIDAEDISFCPGKINYKRSLLICSGNNYKEQCMEYAYCVFLKLWEQFKDNSNKNAEQFRQDFLEWKEFMWSLLSFRYINDESSCRSFIVLIDKIFSDIKDRVENCSLLNILSDMDIPFTVDDENSNEINYHLRIERAKALIRKGAADQKKTDDDIRKAEILFVYGEDDPKGSALSDTRRYVDLSFIIDNAMKVGNKPEQLMRYDNEWITNLNDILKDADKNEGFYERLEKALDKGRELYKRFIDKPREIISQLVSMGWEPVHGRVNNSLRCLCCSAQFDFALFLQNRYKMDAESRDYLGELLENNIDSEQANPDIPVWKKFLITHCKYSEDYDMFRWCRAGYIGFFRDDEEIWYTAREDMQEKPLHLILNSATKWSYHIDAGLHYLVYNLDNKGYKWSCKTHAIVNIYIDDKFVATLKSINPDNAKWVYQLSFENDSKELNDPLKDLLARRQEKCKDCIELEYT